ncbi:SpoIIE family protein phosphatase [Terriglobus aquaticus]|uniref:SpoIIE family protein phosphatase n=1 Tax=Terriglobus aquaticus TaxID=940139 RepID=A0ABW9KNG0_9BACT|nr:SpoIIE family protein phosphatase [Terriglobus aquaticus]
MAKRTNDRVEISTAAQPSAASEVHVSRPDFFGPEMEGDYRPTDPQVTAKTEPPRVSIPQDTAALPHVDFLLRLADALNSTLDLQTLMTRLSDLVRAVVQYRIFAILLLNERSQELWMRFQIGHAPEVERTRVKLGAGIVGRAAQTRRAVLVNDVREDPSYINANNDVRSELAVPLISKNRVIGVIDVESEEVGAFTTDQQRLLELVASRVAVSIENARLYTRVSRQAQTLAVLNDISREITSILDLDDLLERIGSLLKRVVDFQMFTILLWSDRTQQFEHRFSTRYGERVRRERGAVYGVGLIGSAAQLREPVLAPDVRKDPRYIAVNAEVRSELAVPLLYKGRVIGVLDVEHTRLNYYNEEHQRTLTTLAGQIAIAISNARLYERIFEEEQRMERDLQMAREVQLRLLPPPPSSMPHAEFAAQFLPARSIGGDVYDFIPYGPGRVAIAIGDVSGKAAPAALYAALVMGILRLLAAQHLSPAAMLKALNDQLQERRLSSQYVTMLFAVWDDNARTLRVANAGSVQPLLLTRVNGEAKVQTLKAEGFPLGLFPVADYDEVVVTADPGDMVTFFSDGISDAEDRHGEMFGSDRICESLQRAAPESAEAAVAAVFQAVDDFQGGAERFDDETLVILRVR